MLTREREFASPIRCWGIRMEEKPLLSSTRDLCCSPWSLHDFPVEYATHVPPDFTDYIAYQVAEAEEAIEELLPVCEGHQ
eukprot:5199323-Amphidinium_carterae.1